MSRMSVVAATMPHRGRIHRNKAVAAGRLPDINYHALVSADVSRVYISGGETFLWRQDRWGSVDVARAGGNWGLAASALHGARWVGVDGRIELISNARPRRGLIVRNEALSDNKVTSVGKLGSRLPRAPHSTWRQLLPRQAIARIDALMYATLSRPRTCCCSPSAIGSKRPQVAQGGIAACRRRRCVTEGNIVALVLIDAGLPRPTTQISSSNTTVDSCECSTWGTSRLRGRVG